MERFAVVGSGGAGKSTFSDELGARTGIPVHHLDRLFWHPGWVETPRDEWRAVQADLLVGDRWIVDGNYGGTFDVRFARADTVVVLALFAVAVRAACAAPIDHDRGRSIQAEGCPERVDPTFVRWVWRYETDSRPRLDAALARHPHLDVVELRTPREVTAFLDRAG